MSLWRRVALFWVIASGTVFVVAQAPPSPAEVLHVTTQLVVLDATVLDKAGHVVTQSLGREDFQIEENKKPQEIFPSSRLPSIVLLLRTGTRRSRHS
jgi:hypothetical protein